MNIGRDDRVRMERAHVLAWPALDSAVMDGWLWRYSGGGSQRANSVSALDFTGNDLSAAIDAMEARYRAVGAPARFHTYDDTAPSELADALRQRQYTQGDTTVTMFRRLTAADVAGPAEAEPDPSQDWLAVYLGAITESRRAVNRQILRSVPAPHAFFRCQRNGETISTALCVIGFGCAVIECVATRPDARQQGGARAVLKKLLSWAATQQADTIGLQVVAGNTAGVRLYESLGFVAGATNQFWLAGPGRQD